MHTLMVLHNSFVFKKPPRFFIIEVLALPKREEKEKEGGDEQKSEFDLGDSAQYPAEQSNAQEKHKVGVKVHSTECL